MSDINNLLDEFEHECFMLRREASETRAKNDDVRTAYERIRDWFAERIAATLGRGTCEIASGEGGSNNEHCSNCGEPFYGVETLNFCPKCGRAVKR